MDGENVKNAKKPPKFSKSDSSDSSFMKTLIPTYK